MTMPATIFVLIASYRDAECQWTVKDLFEKAEFPDRVQVGICWQADRAEDSNCFVHEARPEQVKTVFFHPTEARGLGWARAHAQSLWQGEDFVLQIDSHMRFVQNWDRLMIEQLEACDAEKAILTVYPPGYTPPGALEEDAPARVQCVREFSPSGMLFYSASRLPSGMEATSPIPTACLAGGFIFGTSAWLQAVAHDPDIYFNGEEHALATRLWTHGFDLFSPSEILLYHYYVREEAPKVWSDDNAVSDKQKRSSARLKQLVTPAMVPKRDHIELGKYGLGWARSLAEYETWSGIDFSAQSIAPFAKVFPFVRTSDVVSSIRADREWKIADGAALFIVDDEGILFSEVRGEIYHLNSAATWVWCSIEDGVAWDEIVSGLSTVCGFDASEAEDALMNLIVHWRGQEVLVSEEAAVSDPGLEPTREQPEDDSETSPAPLDEKIQFTHTQDYVLITTRIRIEFENEEQYASISPSFTHLEDNNTSNPDHVISIVRARATDESTHEPTDASEPSETTNHVFVDGKESRKELTDSELTTQIKYEFVIAAMESVDIVLGLHAGVVEKNGSVIAIPGASGSGKSTLIAGLLRKNYRYYTDDYAPLAKGTGKVIPVPIGLCIKDTGIPVLLDLYPELAELPICNRPDKKQAVYMPAPDNSMVATGEGKAITHVIFNRYEPGAPTEFVEMSNISTFSRLLEQCVSLPKGMSYEDAESLVEWLEQISCYELISGSLDEAVLAIEQLTQQ